MSHLVASEGFVTACLSSADGPALPQRPHPGEGLHWVADCLPSWPGTRALLRPDPGPAGEDLSASLLAKAEMAVLLALLLLLVLLPGLLLDRKGLLLLQPSLLSRRRLLHPLRRLLSLARPSALGPCRPRHHTAQRTRLINCSFDKVLFHKSFLIIVVLGLRSLRCS